MTPQPTYNHIPALRFPDFLNDGEWEVKRLGDLFVRITDRNKENNRNVLTISAQYGLVNQFEYFSKNVAATDVTNYYIIKKGDFAYNKSRSQGYPFGAIKPLLLYEKGVVSTLYICFRLKEDSMCDADFFRFYFETGIINDQISNIAQEGARNHGLLNISTDDFFNINLLVPPLTEQRRIAACLSALDEMLAATNGKLEQLKAYKKGLVQNLFNQRGGVINNINNQIIGRLRFPEFYNEKEWEEKKLGELTNTFSGGTPTASNKEYYGGDIPFIRSGEINSNSTELFLTQLGLENSAAKLVEKGTILYALYGATSGEVGIAKIGGAINQAILAIIPCEKLDPLFLFFSLQNQKDSIVNQYIQGGQGNLSGSIINSLNFSFPSLPEQRKIASCLFAMDDQINAYTEKVGLLGQYKKGLMQRMFLQNQMN